jgi:glycosyltransferase involved in cell wall biosynthesis
MSDISVLIPARNEEFLARTIEDLLENCEVDTEILIGLDGSWAEPRIPDNPKVTILHYTDSIGQRAITNQLCKLSKSKYIVKCDAHCSFEKGWDRKMLEAYRQVGDNVTMVPVMRNLHAFDWVCKNGHRRYQGPSGACTECKEPTTKDVVWIAKTNPQSTSYRFDKEPHFQYFNEYKKRPEYQEQLKTGLTETMSLQGSFFMLTRDKYWELNVCDEEFGSWGSQGIEVAVKTWLSGGRVLCNHNTWYAHMFRTQGGDFGFPYPISGKQVEFAKSHARELFLNGKWNKSKRPLQWLIDKFSPVPDWNTPSKEILYYTCNTHKPGIDEMCRQQLLKSTLPITSVSLNKDIDFGSHRLRMDGERSPLTMHKQILLGLQASKADYVFLAESDVLYPPSHFDFLPNRKDVFYFDTNVWKLRWSDGHCVWTDNLQQLSGMVASRELMLEFFTKRVAQIEKEGFNRHYEPSPRQNVFPKERGGKYGQENYMGKEPMVCIRHDANITASKWSLGDFINKDFAKGWKESDEIPFWGKGKDIITCQN